jgi:hypothetical protein
MRQDDVEPTRSEDPSPDDGGMYVVFGEGKPRHIVGDSDEPPRRRPRKKTRQVGDEIRPDAR